MNKLEFTLTVAEWNVAIDPIVCLGTDESRKVAEVIRKQTEKLEIGQTEELTLKFTEKEFKQLYLAMRLLPFYKVATIIAKLVPQIEKYSEKKE